MRSEGSQAASVAAPRVPRQRGGVDGPAQAPPLRARVAETPWRRRLAARGAVDRAYRSVVGLVGGLIVLVGLVAVPLPGPGWLTVLGGLFVLSSEFRSAERLLERTQREVQRWTSWLLERSVAVRLALATASGLLGYVVLVVTLRVVGVPAWVPSWAPLLG